MGYLKTLLSKDIIITPFRVHKSFSYSGAPPTYNVDGVSVFNGRNIDYPLGGGEEGTGSLSLVYNSIKQLYYSNYIGNNQSEGRVSSASLPQYNPDGTVIGSNYTPNYINNIQSIDERRYFPTGSNKNISVLSIPSKQFGEYLKPGSVSCSGGIHDDGQGNLLNASDKKVGNVIYEAGLCVFVGIEGVGGTAGFNDPHWESSVTIYETQYKCTIRSNECNYSLNPSLLKDYGSDLILKEGKANYKNFVTSSDFSPYVTTVGLYDDDQNLLAVAKLAQPLAISQTTDTTILINLDR